MPKRHLPPNRRRPPILPTAPKRRRLFLGLAGPLFLNREPRAFIKPKQVTHMKKISGKTIQGLYWRSERAKGGVNCVGQSMGWSTDQVLKATICSLQMRKILLLACFLDILIVGALLAYEGCLHRPSYQTPHYSKRQTLV